MDHSAYEFDVRSTTQSLLDEAAGLLMGIGFTLALFLGMAHVENVGTPPTSVDIQDLRTYTVPFEPPPPLPSTARQPEQVDASPPLAGIEPGHTDSPVSIGVVPPDLEVLFPSTTSVAKVRYQFTALHTDLKPKMELEVDLGHIYQESEVDQKPRAVVRTAPPVPAEVSGTASTMRVLLLLVLDPRGKVESVRVVESSGSTRFDEIVATTVHDDWRFSPAIRRGKKVRVMAQQAFRVNFSSGSSPFSLDP